MNIIYSREEVIFLVFSHLNVYYTPHFHFSVVNYSLGCKEVYIIVIFFFSPEADGPKKCIVRLYLDSFGHHSLLEENAWDVVAFSFSQTKDFWLFLRRDLQVEFGANHKTEEEVKSFLLLPYSPLRRKESILCPKLGQKKGGGGGFESNCSPSHADCRSLQAHTHLPSSRAILTYWFIQRASSFKSGDWRSPTAELPLVEQLTRSLERWATHIQCMHCDW